MCFVVFLLQNRSHLIFQCIIILFCFLGVENIYLWICKLMKAIEVIHDLFTTVSLTPASVYLMAQNDGVSFRVLYLLDTFIQLKQVNNILCYESNMLCLKSSLVHISIIFTLYNLLCMFVYLQGITSLVLSDGTCTRFESGPWLPNCLPGQKAPFLKCLCRFSFSFS